MEKEQTLWDWCSDGRGSSVLCGEKRAHNQTMDRPQHQQPLRKLLMGHKDIPGERDPSVSPWGL